MISLKDPTLDIHIRENGHWLMCLIHLAWSTLPHSKLFPNREHSVTTDCVNDMYRIFVNSGWITPYCFVEHPERVLSYLNPGKLEYLGFMSPTAFAKFKKHNRFGRLHTIDVWGETKPMPEKARADKSKNPFKFFAYGMYDPTPNDWMMRIGKIINHMVVREI